MALSGKEKINQKKTLLSIETDGKMHSWSGKMCQPKILSLAKPVMQRLKFHHINSQQQDY